MSLQLSGTMSSCVISPARWAIGPPAPRAVAYVARGAMLVSLVLVVTWVSSLGGLAVHPTWSVEMPEENDTSKIFNWHPLLMTLAFAVCMAEAVLTYQAPALPWIDRETRKKVHWALHACAVTLLALGLVAVFKSHSLKRPVPMPDLYSPHSILGLTTTALVGLQFILGAVSYLKPKLPIQHRVAMGPVHRFLGAATWCLGIATMAVGIQEKCTFMQTGKKLSGAALYDAMRLPSVLLVFLVLLVLSVLYHLQPAARPVNVDGAGAKAGGVGGGPGEHSSLLGGDDRLA